MTVSLSFALSLAHLALGFATISIAEPLELVLTPYLFFCLIALLCSSRIFSRKSPVLLILSAYLLVYYHLRIFELLCFRETTVSFFPIADASPVEIGTTLYYIGFTCSALITGVLFTTFIPYRSLSRQSLETNLPTPEVLFAVHLLFWSVIYVLNKQQGGAEGIQFGGVGGKIVALLIHPDIAFFVYLISATLHDRLFSKLTVLTIIVYVVARAIILYSRGGIIEIAFLYFAWALAWRGNIEFKLNFKVVALGSAFLAFTIASFFWVSYLRIANYDLGSDAGDFTANLFFDLTNAEGLIQQLTGITYRLGSSFDASLIVNTPFFDTNTANQLVNIQQTIQSIVSRALQIDFSSEPFMFSEHAFAYTIGIDPYYLDGNLVNVAYIWGPFALSQHLFGYLGGIAFFAIFGFLLCLVGKLLLQSHLPAGAKFILVPLTYMIFQAWLITFGLDNLADRFMRFTIAFIFLYGGLHLIFPNRNHQTERPPSITTF